MVAITVSIGDALVGLDRAQRGNVDIHLSTPYFLISPIAGCAGGPAPRRRRRVPARGGSARENSTCTTAFRMSASATRATSGRPARHARARPAPSRAHRRGRRRCSVGEVDRDLAAARPPPVPFLRERSVDAGSGDLERVGGGAQTSASSKAAEISLLNSAMTSRSTPRSASIRIRSVVSLPAGRICTSSRSYPRRATSSVARSLTLSCVGICAAPGSVVGGTVVSVERSGRWNVRVGRVAHPSTGSPVRKRVGRRGHVGRPEDQA